MSHTVFDNPDDAIYAFAEHLSTAKSFIAASIDEDGSVKYFMNGASAQDVARMFLTLCDADDVFKNAFMWAADYVHRKEDIRDN